MQHIFVPNAVFLDLYHVMLFRVASMRLLQTNVHNKKKDISTRNTPLKYPFLINESNQIMSLR